MQLQVHKAILHSFAKASVSLVDHHTASDSFVDFHREEIGKRGKCPADWVWVTPPAGGSMTKVFHQEMVRTMCPFQLLILSCRGCVGIISNYVLRTHYTVIFTCR